MATAATIYSFGNSQAVPSNTIASSEFNLNTGSGSTITGVELTAVFSPGQTSHGTEIPLLAGYVWLELERSTILGTQTIRLFDFPGTYPNPPGVQIDTVFGYSDVRVELNGAYVFDDSASSDFHEAAVALAGGFGITVPPSPPYSVLSSGTYRPSVDSLSVLIGLGTDATYRVRAASFWSGTRGSVDWQLSLTTVPEPGTALMISLGLGVLSLSRSHRNPRN